MKYIIPAMLLLSLATASCNKMLDEKVVTNVTDDFYNTKAGFQTAVNGSYVSMRNFYSTERGITLTETGTDIMTNGSDGNYKFTSQYTSQLDSRYDHVREVWNSFYQTLNTCNVAIDRADKVKDLDSASKKVGVAEAKFCRAHYHFILMEMFGAVPLSLKENAVILREAHRDSVSAVYNAVINDLLAAEKDLPASQTDWGRATKPAVEHLLARVYLTRASSPQAQATDYANAAKYADMVIKNYGFKLLDDPGMVWAQGKENNSETIWAAQYTTDPLYGYPDNNACRFFLMQYDVLPGMKRDLPNGTPWKRFRPTSFLLDTLYQDRVHDVRYEKWFTTVWYTNSATATLNLGDTAIYLPGYNVTDAVIATKKYLMVPPRLYTEKLYPSLNKFADALRPDNQASGVRPFISFRLAETYLIEAEAALMQGDATTAANLVNVVRARAARIGATDAETQANRTAMQVTPGMMTIDYLLDERGRELAGEQLRWFDLVRTHKLLERVKLHNNEARANIKPTHVLRPIPQDQIDRTVNEFLQNPGY
ncbi:RagB/SusD family nutrient uptake outer membrane protein [Chitinophaga sp. Cy-1792]|uniref:RagB/SusD family nutrient uptake outer membrane protein n=1 Tax=Chitinophaga sp. Cy-1792 TaxID=2608339 RepID=UPI00141D9E29|nr:RagB/SusD family nutrient uptake outer membrane protein [Chitinophaga sp. Cy-1792]NIG54873.1 RagB/SusD family nutrient uptake outer membrane protein [Chitinophaga sp. Cy-1792]